MTTTPNIERILIEGADHLCLLRFDKPGSRANTLDVATLEELQAHLDAIASDPGIHGLIIASAKPAIFIAGADLALFRKPDAALLETYLELGQRVFNQLAELKIPTIAAIAGACVGGGYELALACDYRIATDEHATRIGLPETTLGIVPGWGGCTRLPRLVGVPTALEVILGGKTYRAHQALRLGLVDQLSCRERLLKAALNVLNGQMDGKRLEKSHPGLFQRPLNKAMATAIGGRTRADVMRRTRGHYPAVLRALEVITEGAGESDPAPSLARERKAIADLAPGPVARNLYHVMTLQENTRRWLRREGEGVTPIREVAVIGAGVMGAGIAQWLSARGLRVTLCDLDNERVGAGMARIFKTYNDAVKGHRLTSMEARDGIDRISPAPGTVPLGRVQLVIEAIVERLGAKEALFADLDRRTPPEALLASNTSALPIHAMAAATNRPSRVIGMHFFNPVARMKLVELVLPDGVEPEARRQALGLLSAIGKLPVVVRDTPGFLVNRVLLPYLLEAARTFDSGIAASVIDETMLDFGMPMGPLRLVDEVGLDVALEVARTLEAAFPGRFAVPPVLPRMVEAGLLGRKAKAGFYTYRNAHPAAANPAAQACAAGGLAHGDAATARLRMLYRMLDEAARCLDEKVVETPEAVDLAMILGAGFPPFRGGLLRYADSIGLEPILHEMEILEIQPGEPLLARAARKRSFYEDDE